MKNQYEIKQSYIVQLENEQLRERVKELSAQINELKRENETKNNREMVQSKGKNAIIQE
jgi:regulator of replication initiation timing